jgi:hypothetical protein
MAQWFVPKPKGTRHFSARRLMQASIKQASEGRGQIKQRMTCEQISEAQALARRCMGSDYQDCN